MARFKSALDDIGSFFKKVFVPVNKVIVAADTAVIQTAPLVNLIPGFGAMIESGAQVIAQVEAAAASAGAQTGTGETKLAIAIPTITPIVVNYLEANGLSAKSASSIAIITSALVTILNELGFVPAPVQVAPTLQTP